MSARPAIYAQAFTEALQAYAEERHLGVEALAGLLQRPRSTIYRWLCGKSAPTRTVLRQICEQLHWNYEVFFQEALLREQLVQRDFLSFTALSRRYLQLRERDRLQAQTVLGLAAVQAQAWLIQKGCPARLELDDQLQARLCLTEPGFAAVLTFQGGAADGIQFQAWHPTMEVFVTWAMLAEDTLESLVRVLGELKQRMVV
jgi:transcriptional regulator with XRE-family HTH domain